jgi:O-antigen biosynthesis protein
VGFTDRARELWYEHGYGWRAVGGIGWQSSEGISSANGESLAWKRSVTVGGIPKPALVGRTPSTRVFRLVTPERAAFVAWLGIELDAGDATFGDVVFTVTMRPADGSPSHSVRYLRSAGEGWERMPVRVPLEDFAGREIDLVLSTSSLQRGLRAFWAMPSVCVRRSISELMGLALGYVDRYGLGSGRMIARRLARREEATERSAYEAWVKRNRPRRAGLALQALKSRRLHSRPTISLLVSVEGSNPTKLAATVASVRRQSYPFWELCLVTRKQDPSLLAATAGDDRIKTACNGCVEAAGLMNGLRIATGEFVAVLESGDQLDPRALYLIAELIDRHPDADLIYTDHDTIDGSGVRFDPFFKPGWSPDYLLSCMYTGRLCVYRRALADEVGGREELEEAQECALALKAGEQPKRVHHIPHVLYHSTPPAKTHSPEQAKKAIEHHLEQNGVEGWCEEGPSEGLFRIRYRIRGEPLVSILVPTTGHPRDAGQSSFHPLETCLRSLLALTSYAKYEVLCVDDGEKAHTVELLRAVGDPRVRQVSFHEPFNYARKLNFAAACAQGEHLVFLNDDTEVLEPDWLSAMLEHSQLEGVGAVGAKLHFPGGGIQHGGVIIASGRPSHAFYGCPSDHPGYHFNLLVTCNYSAVTAACMMTSRRAFADVRGFSEAFPFNYNDVDYCLRLSQRGYRIVFTPHAELRHFESLSREGMATEDELRLFRSIWGGKADPFYSPNFRQDRSDFAV